MAEYIEREALLGAIDCEFFKTDPDGAEQIGVLKCRRIAHTLPAADVAPVVHCRDCKHARKSKEAFEFDAVTPLCECSYMKLPHRWYEYCSWGERRSE